MKTRIIKNPTHRLVHDGREYALIYCGKGRPAVMLNGETVRSASFMLDCDLLMGRWQAGLHYLFGSTAESIPIDAKMEKL